MGLFSGKEPKTWLGRYVAHVGAWGLLAIPFALIFALSFVTDVKDRLTLSPVEATVVSMRSECRLEWTVDGDSKTGKVRPCAEAERYRDESTKRLYRIDRDDFATVEWVESGGQAHRAELSDGDTGKLGNPDPGETVSVIARGGAEPKAATAEDGQGFAITAALFAFCAWLAWPPRRPGNERRPLFYVRRRKGFKGGVAEAVANWSFLGFQIGAIVACVGVFFFMVTDRSPDRYVSAEARVVGIAESCRLSPDNGKVLKIESLQKISCERARAIRRNRPEENYAVLERPDYTLRYADLSGAIHEKEMSTSAIRDLDPVVGSSIAIDLRSDDPTRFRMAPDAEDGGDRTTLDHTMMLYGGLLALISGLISWVFGLRFDHSRFTGGKARPQRMVRRRT